MIEYQALLLTEPLAAFLLAAGLLAFINAASHPPSGMPWAWLGSGVLLGLLVLVRPEYLPLTLLLPLAWLLWEAVAGGSLRRVTLLASTSLLATVLVLAPWTIRNAIVLDRLRLSRPAGARRCTSAPTSRPTATARSSANCCSTNARQCARA